MLDWDLAIAGMAIGTLSVIAFLIAAKSGASSKSPIRTLAVCIAIFVVFWVMCFAKLAWAKFLPVSAAIVWSNLTPIILAFAAGIAWKASALNRTRLFAVCSLSALAIAYLVNPVIRPWFAPPNVAIDGKSKGPVCLQSHESTCAPASAATLLRLSGIPSSEKEMIGPCLTSKQGTEVLGIFRGLTIGCRDRGLKVRVAAPNPKHWAFHGQLPALAMVHFPGHEFELLGDTRPIPRRILGQRPEASHAIVVMAHERGKWTVADPAIGLVKWSDEEMRIRFTGDALYLKRN